MNVKLYVEGGGQQNSALKAACRRGFREFFSKAGLRRCPDVVPSRSGAEASKDFQSAVAQGESAVLLVDSEGPVRIESAAGERIHFMVQAMEAWFHADKVALERYYGQGFRVKALRQASPETILKADLFAGLKAASKECQKGEYSKSNHSFEILAQIDPAKVRKASPYADRLLTTLDSLCEP